MAWIKGGPQPFRNSGSIDELLAPSRREQLRSKNRSRPHHRMIEGLRAR